MRDGKPELSDYLVEFRQLPLLYTWTYRITAPTGAEHRPLAGMFMTKENAEKAALEHIKMLESQYTVNGLELEEKHGR